MFRFEQLQVYQKALGLTDTIYRRTYDWPKEHLYGLTDQLRRAVMSIGLNIAEGSSRSRKEFKRFLDIARGSCFECVPLVDLASKQGLISGVEKQEWYNRLVELAKMISSLKTSV